MGSKDGVDFYSKEEGVWAHAREKGLVGEENQSQDIGGVLASSGSGGRKRVYEDDDDDDDEDDSVMIGDLKGDGAGRVDDEEEEDSESHNETDEDPDEEFVIAPRRILRLSKRIMLDFVRCELRERVHGTLMTIADTPVRSAAAADFATASNASFTHRSSSPSSRKPFRSALFTPIWNNLKKQHPHDKERCWRYGKSPDRSGLSDNWWFLAPGSKGVAGANGVDYFTAEADIVARVAEEILQAGPRVLTNEMQRRRIEAVLKHVMKEVGASIPSKSTSFKDEAYRAASGVAEGRGMRRVRKPSNKVSAGCSTAAGRPTDARLTRCSPLFKHAEHR